MSFSPEVLLKTNYGPLISGRGSAIDDIIVHNDFPFSFISRIEFKCLNTQQIKLTLNQRSILVIYIQNKKVQEIIKNNFNLKGVEIMLLKKSAISFFLKEYYLHFFNKQFKDPIVKQFIRNGEMRFFTSINDLSDGLKEIFDENHKLNLDL